MATEEAEKNNEERKGFAGLSSLVSDVDTSLPPSTERTAAASDAAPNGERRKASDNPESKPQPTQPKQQPYQWPPPPTSGSSTVKWVLGIVAVIGVLWLIGEGDNSPSSPGPSYSPPERSATPRDSAAPARPQVLTRPDEVKPPVGQGLVFSTSQIRYCLAEDIRLDAGRDVLNNPSDSDVDRFNAMVADYNSRCSSFRYRSGALGRARLDVEQYRSQIQAEGRSRFTRSPTTGSLSAPAPTRAVADETVRALQQKLNELGYAAGPADGLMGRRTRAAIVAFQRDAGLNPDGLPTSRLLQHLLEKQQSDAPEAPQGSPTPVSPSPSAVPPAANSSQRVLYSQEQTTVSAAEQSAIERACNSTRQYSGPGAYYNCLNRELSSLTASGGRPDISRFTAFERSAIERACHSAREYSGPGAYYNCLNRQIASLRSSGGAPDLSNLTPAATAAVKRACESSRQYSAPLS